MGSSPLLKNGPQLVFGPLELARQRRALERKSDRAGAREGEDPGLKVQRVAFFFAFADLSAIAILA